MCLVEENEHVLFSLGFTKPYDDIKQYFLTRDDSGKLDFQHNKDKGAPFKLMKNPRFVNYKNIMFLLYC